MKDPLLHHHFTPESLLALDWSPVIDLRVQRTNGEHSHWNGYHEAVFSIGPDETGHILIPDTALAALASAGKISLREGTN